MELIGIAGKEIIVLRNVIMSICRLWEGKAGLD